MMKKGAFEITLIKIRIQPNFGSHERKGVWPNRAEFKLVHCILRGVRGVLAGEGVCRLRYSPMLKSGVFGVSVRPGDAAKCKSKFAPSSAPLLLLIGVFGPADLAGGGVCGSRGNGSYESGGAVRCTDGSGVSWLRLGVISRDSRGGEIAADSGRLR